MNKVYKDFLNSIFQHKTAFLGEQIANKLVNKFNISRDYARRIIKVAVDKKILFSSKPLRFSHGQYGYSNINNKSVFHQLLDSRGGLKELYKILCITCFPENEMIKHAQSIYTDYKPEEALDKLIQDFQMLGTIKEYTYNNCRFYYLPNNGKNDAGDTKCESILQNLKKEAKICQLVYSYCLNLN